MSSAEPGVPDGMKVDTEGRVFCTGSGGIWVISPEGERLGRELAEDLLALGADKVLAEIYGHTPT